jgi:hypothetical protein
LLHSYILGTVQWRHSFDILKGVMRAETSKTVVFPYSWKSNLVSFGPVLVDVEILAV